MEAPVPEQGAGELDEPEVVGWFLVVADEDGAALREPGEGALDDPAAGGAAVPAPLVELLLADAADVRCVAGLLGCTLAARVVVALVQAELLGVGGRVG